MQLLNGTPGRSTLTSRMRGPAGPPVQRKPQDNAAAELNAQTVNGQRIQKKDDEALMRQAAEQEEQQQQQENQRGGVFGAIGRGFRGVTDRLRRVGEQLFTRQFNDLDATMYRVSMTGGVRLVEQVVRLQDDDGTNFYAATGEVVGFEGERPIVQSYDPPRDLGNWTPRVTHVNGMMVTPESGIRGAETLQDEIAANLDNAAMTPDVLYTYSAKGGFFPDLVDSAKGKLGIDDAVIESQEQIILDAVRNHQRVTVSAHSRGTIKTEAAVRNAHAVLREEFASSLTSGPEADAAAAEATEMAQRLASEGKETISPDLAAEIARQGAAERLAGQAAWDAIETYVQLIYAGNAVTFPSPPAELVVGRSDFVSMSVGRYFQMGRDIKRFVKISGGHSFDTNYAATVGEWIAADLAGLPNS
ncbi:hypothetical protein [Haliangium ochraceum]|uniref:hypothetical protein n=1 Tax=Haliangium ochraceum TaxID=80816 RepID=UPI001269996E|nr:hypothetical protein [Haliangium ochraceum]